MSAVFKELFLGKKEVTIEGDIIFLDGVRRGRLSFSRGNGLIRSLDDNKEADLVLEEGLIFPGFVDIHVHAREDPSRKWTYKEDFSSAGKAALAGGVTAFGDMPNTPDPLVDEEGFRKKHLLSRFAGMDVLLYAGIGPDTRPLPHRVPYKVYMGKSVGGLFFRNRKELRDALSRYKGESVSFHCEDPDILKQNEKKLVHTERRPPEAEVIAVETALELIEEFKLKGKICHVSTREALELIGRARKKGVEAQLEASPHHLLLEDNGDGIEFPKCLRSTGKVPSEGFFQVNPPIRGKRDREALFKAFKEGKIDYLATDHAPHTIEEKEKGTSGLPHLDTYGNVVGCLLEMGVPPEVLGKTIAYKPGEFISEFGFSSREVKVGSSANLTVLVRREEDIQREGLFTKAGWSPFEGRTFPWRVEFTVLGGRAWKKEIV